MLDQSGLVIQRPGTGAAGLAGVGPVGTNRALGAGDRAGRPGPGRVHGRGVLLPGGHLVPGAEERGRAAVDGPAAAGRVHPADLQRLGRAGYAGAAGAGAADRLRRDRVSARNRCISPGRTTTGRGSSASCTAASATGTTTSCT